MTPETKALNTIPPAELHRDEWVNTGMAYHSATNGQGVQQFHDWSSQDERYKFKDAESVWRSFKLGGPVGAGSLFHTAKQYGYRGEEFTPEERIKWARERSKREAEAVAARAKQETDILMGRDAARRKATAMWSLGVPATKHPYLSRKNIKGEGARVLGSLLLLPVIGFGEYGELVGLQVISDKKMFLSGQEMGYMIIGDDDPKWVVEGYATGASLYESTGQSVMVAFNAGGIFKACQHLFDHGSLEGVTIMGDDDRGKAKNAGRHAANKAANYFGVNVAFPEFRCPPECPCSDFNDHVNCDS